MGRLSSTRRAACCASSPSRHWPSARSRPGRWPPAPAAGATSAPGHPRVQSLNLVASALEVSPGALYVGGKFTDAGGIPTPTASRSGTAAAGARSARRRSRSRTARSSRSPSRAARSTPAARSTNAGGTADADNLAVWDGTSWKPFCTPPGHDDRERHSPAGRRADPLRRGRLPGRRGHRHRRLPARVRPGHRHPELHRRRPGPPVLRPRERADRHSDGTLYAGGRFSTSRTSRPPTTSRTCPRRDVARHGLRAAARCGCALDAFVRGLATNGTDVFVGTEDRTSPASPRPTTSRSGTDRRGAPWARTPAAPTGGSRRRPTSTASPASARTCSPPGRSRTRTATRAPTTSPGSTAPPGTRSGPTAPATARGSVRARPRARRPAALCGGELHERRR